MTGLYFEDFEVGAERQFGGYTFTAEAIKEFAAKFDPQPFHLDEAAARRSPFGGLIASGWHTSSAVMRLLVDELLGEKSGSLGSPGIDEIRWTRPVRPGDTITVRTRVIEVKPSRRKPDRGIIRTSYSVRNQNDEEVMTMIGIGIFLKRGTPAGA
jgi:acyl dehydratase